MLEQFLSRRAAIRQLRASHLGDHLNSFTTDLAKRGFARWTGRWQLYLLAGFGRWLAKRRCPVADIDDQVVRAFLERRGRHSRRRRGEPRTICSFVAHLRERGVIAAVATPAPSATELLRQRYTRFLKEERGLTFRVVSNYWRFAERFLVSRFAGGPLSFEDLSQKHVSDFLLRHARARSCVHAQLMASALRSFLRFLFQEGQTDIDLSASIPHVRRWRLSTVPRHLPPGAVERVLAACDRRTPLGRRDYAILLLLARLGLRAGEVATLELHQIDWRTGQLMIPGKALSEDRLPLLPDVGQALADYLRRDRLVCASRRVFLRARAPIRGFSSGAPVGVIVRKAVERAGIKVPKNGAHLLRHTLATDMLRGGASLWEIGEVLRHRSPQTTEIYAKVDFDRLRSLARPWPAVGGPA